MAKKYVLRKLSEENLEKDCRFTFKGDANYKSLYGYISYFMDAERMPIYLKSISNYDWFNDNGKKRLHEMSKLINKLTRMNHLK